MELQQNDDEIRKELGLGEKFGGVIVVQVRMGSPADEAGLIRGDIILEIDRKPIRSVDDFDAIVRKRKSYLLRIRRQDGRGRENYSVVNLNLADMPVEE
jgi:S1-C subfamily serine protease